MIVVRIDLISAVTGNTTRLGAATISNIGGSRKLGDYTVKVARKPHAVANAWDKIEAQPLRTGEVKDYPRLSYNIWRLIIRALLSAFPEEKADATR